MKVKWWHVLLGLIAISVMITYFVPPNVRCKWEFWNKNACSQVQAGSKLLTNLGYPIDPNKPLITQGGYTKATGDVVGSFQEAVF